LNETGLGKQVARPAVYNIGPSLGRHLLDTSLKLKKYAKGGYFKGFMRNCVQVYRRDEAQASTAS